MIAPENPTAQIQAAAMPRAIEVGFPIVEINRLAEPERNSFKPIYQMHKWFARRASCVFRAILLGALKPAVQPDGTPTDLMAEFYKNHAEDPDTKGKVVLDPFMGGGTTVVEALRLGCKPIGIDLNPVAWFIVKTEIEPVEIEALHAAFERLAARPVAWNEGKPLRDTLLDLYKTEAAPGVEADVIYTFWVKHAICTDPTCKKEAPLFKDYIVAHKIVSVRYWRDLACPECGNAFDWETQVASLIAEKKLMVNAPRGAAGEGRPTAASTYAPEPEKPTRRRVHSPAELDCPCCARRIKLAVPGTRRKKRKRSRSPFCSAPPVRPSGSGAARSLTAKWPVPSVPTATTPMSVTCLRKGSFSAFSVTRTTSFGASDCCLRTSVFRCAHMRYRHTCPSKWNKPQMESKAMEHRLHFLARARIARSNSRLYARLQRRHPCLIAICCRRMASSSSDFQSPTARGCKERRQHG